MILLQRSFAIFLLGLPLAACGVEESLRSLSAGASGSFNREADIRTDADGQIVITDRAEGSRLALPGLSKSIQQIGGTATVPAQRLQSSWSQAGGSAHHSLGHAALSAAPNLVWRSQVSPPMRRGRLATTEPLILGDLAFVLSWDLRVSAINLADGQLVWRVNLHPEADAGGIFGGGLAADEDFLYVTTGAGELHALRQDSGARIWIQPLAAPSQAGPLIYNNRLYVNDVTGNMTAFSLDGVALWNHSAVGVLTNVLGAGTPAGGSSGIFNLSADGILRVHLPFGDLAWQADTALSGPAGQVSDAISDTRALPVLKDDMVLVSGWSNRTLAFDVSSGAQLWEFPIGGAATPAVTDDHVFLVTKDGILRALRCSDGAQVWALDLGREGRSIRIPAVGWQGPVLAGGNLILGSSEGLLRFIDPATGANRRTINVGAPIVTPLSVAKNTLLVTTSDGEILAYR